MGYFTNDINASGGGGATDHGALTGLADDDHTQYAIISSGTGAPGTTPGRVGEVYIDTAADAIYHSTGTASSADWTLVSENGHTHPTSDIVSGTFADDRIAESNVTQHESALSITESQISDLGSYITASSTNTLTNKTINTASNNITIVEADISDLGSYITASSTNTLTNKTFDANGTGNSLSNVDVADLANGTDGELITWNTSGVATTIAAGANGHVLTSKGAGAVPVFEAPAAGGGGGGQEINLFGTDYLNDGSTLYKYMSGSPVSASASNYHRLVVDQITFAPLVINEEVSVTKIGTRVTTSGGAGTTARIGIYEIDATKGCPGDLLVDAGTIDVETTGIKEITISETLSAGHYYVAITSDGNPYICGIAGAVVRGTQTLTNFPVSGYIYKASQSGELTSLSDPAVSSLSEHTTFLWPAIWVR